VRRLIDHSKKITHRYAFSAFGEDEEISEEGFNPWRFASKRFDPESKLIYFGKRYYDPELARWLSTDPAGFASGINLYHYLYNNPFRYTDPDGQNPLIIAIPIFELVWGATGIALITPTLPVIIGAVAVGTAIWAGYQVGAMINQEISGDGFFDPLLNKEKERKPSPFPYPGDDPTKCPGEGWEWKGKGKPGSKEGNWINTETDEQFRPDLNHKDPIGPHWDYTDNNGKEYRVYPDGTWEEK
jgi:RHS repeat-associated protein